MAIWQFDFWIIPENSKKEIFHDEEIFSWKVEKLKYSVEEFFGNTLVEEKSWSEKIIQYGDNDKTCIKFRIKDNNIDEISCRLDLRDLNIDLLNKIIEYIIQIQGEIYYEEEIYSADLNIMKNLIKKSNAGKFCLNPQAFFEDLVDKAECEL